MHLLLRPVTMAFVITGLVFAFTGSVFYLEAQNTLTNQGSLVPEKEAMLISDGLHAAAAMQDSFQTQMLFGSLLIVAALCFHAIYVIREERAAALRSGRRQGKTRRIQIRYLRFYRW